MSTVRSRWLAKLNTARHWAAVWRTRYVANPTRHNKWKLEQWRARQREAEKVLDRHPGDVSHVSGAGLDLIREFEGFRACPYRDAVGVWTIGYGETAGIGPRTPCWTEAKARQHLRRRVDRDYLAPVLVLARAVGLILTQNEADALASGTYNLGAGWLGKGKTMGDAIRSKDRQRIADAFLIYDKAGGRTLPGLTRRRQSERALFKR